MASPIADRQGRGKAPHGYPKSLRLRRRAEYRRVQTQGRRIPTPHFLLILLPGPDEGPKLGVTVTKKVGTAVQRNRVKRLVREVFRQHRSAFPTGCALVVIARQGSPSLGYHQVRNEMLGAQGGMRAAAARAVREAGSR
jgi:ribonuclease P protein component